MANLNIASWVPDTLVEGPGKRFALWVQGCNILCPNCCNEEMLSFSPRTIMEVDTVLEMVRDALEQNCIEGVTFLGGEPMLQAKGLSALAKGIQHVGLTVMVFTGFRLEELRIRPLPGGSDLLESTDILVDSPFIDSLPEQDRAWAGSTNQRFHYLSDRYLPGIEYDYGNTRSVELRIDTSSDIHMNGWPVDST